MALLGSHVRLCVVVDARRVAVDALGAVPYVVAPLWALAGAVGAFGLFFRWKRSLGKAVGAAVVGSQLVPWLVLFTTASWDARGGVARAVGLGFLGALAVLVVWLRRGRAS